jgi:hypothetical protein
MLNADDRTGRRRNNMTKRKNKVNKRVVLQSILALIFLGLAFFVHWLFLLPVAVLIWLNQRELFRKN